MASWHPFVLEWTATVPDTAHTAAINNGLKAIDYDAPQLDSGGYSGSWRSPTSGVDLAVIVNAITRLGFPCRAMWAAEDGHGEISTRWAKWVEPDDSDLIGVYEYHNFMLAYLWHFKYGPGGKDKVA